MRDTRQKLLVRDISEALGKLPPSAIDIEESVLGAIILERNALNAVVEFMKPDYFYTEPHKEIYSAIVELFKRSEPIDMRTVVYQLKKSGKIELIGGAYYIAELTSKVSSSANIEYHARILVELALKRELILTACRIHHEAYEDTTDVFELIEDVESNVLKMSDSDLSKNYESAKALMYKAVKELKDRKHAVNGLTGVPSGFLSMDRVTCGWQKSDLVIIAARPGMGKTAFIASAIRNAAVDFNMPVALFSLEMASLQLIYRLICGEAEIDSDKLRQGDLNAYDWQQIINKTSRLSSAPLFIDDTPGLSIIELRAKCRRLKAEHNIQLIAIDYLQLMKGEKAGNREQEIASISRALKGIAKELDVPVIALSQLSRSVETRGGDKRPMLSDLRESGSIEQDADVVMFLYRPEYYKITVDEEGMLTQGQLEVIVAKHRNGSLDTVKLKFIGKYTKVMDFVSVQHEPQVRTPYKDSDDDTPF